MALEAGKKGLETPSFADLIVDLKELLRGAWRFRWQAVLIAWVLCLPLWFFVLTMPDIYKASGRLHIDTEDSLRPLLDGLAIQADLLDDVNFMLKSILSRPTLEQIARRTGYDIGNLDASEEEAMIESLEEAIRMSLDQNQILEISVSDSNPTMAMAIVSVLTDEFVEGLLGSSRSDTRSAQDFLNTKLQEYEVLLAEAEQRLADFKKRNIGQMPGERGSYYTRLQSEMRALDDLDSRIRLTRQRRNDLQAQMIGETPVFGVMAPAPGSGVSDSPQIAQLEAQLTELRLSYTDEHPDVIRTKELLQELRAENAALRAGRPLSETPELDRNPVYQQMKMQFNQAEIELSQFTTERAEQARVVADLRQKIDTIPEIEAELTRLNRSYDVYKSQHEELLGRLEQARLSEDADRSNTSMKFRTIDPPAVTSSPVGPDRVLFMTIAMLFALGAGAAFAAARSITSPVFFSEEKLERRYAARVLGSIKSHQSPAEIRQVRMSFVMLSLTGLALVACYGLLVAFNEQGVQLAGRLTTLFG